MIDIPASGLSQPSVPDLTIALRAWVAGTRTAGEAAAAIDAGWGAGADLRTLTYILAASDDWRPLSAALLRIAATTWHGEQSPACVTVRRAIIGVEISVHSGIDPVEIPILSRPTLAPVGPWAATDRAFAHTVRALSGTAPFGAISDAISTVTLACKLGLGARALEHLRAAGPPNRLEPISRLRLAQFLAIAPKEAHPWHGLR